MNGHNKNLDREKDDILYLAKNNNEIFEDSYSQREYNRIYATALDLEAAGYIEIVELNTGLILYITPKGDSFYNNGGFVGARSRDKKNRLCLSIKRVVRDIIVAVISSVITYILTNNQQCNKNADNRTVNARNDTIKIEQPDSILVRQIFDSVTFKRCSLVFSD